MCPAQPASLDSVGSPSGQPSLGPELEGFLILSCKSELSDETRRQIFDSLGPIAKKAGLQPIVLSDGMEVAVRYARDPIVEELSRLSKAIESMALSNMALIQAMAEGDGMDDSGVPEVYMDGRPVR